MTDPAPSPPAEGVAAEHRSNRRMYAAIAALVVVWAAVMVLRTPIQARYFAWQLTRTLDANAHRHYFHRLASLRGGAVPAVRGLIEDERPEVRNTGALLLHYARTAESRALLLRCLSDPDAEVRRTAAMGLALDDSPDVVEALRGRLSDGDESAAALAAATLGRMGGERATEALLSALPGETRVSVKAELIDGLGQIKAAEAVPLLVEALADDRPLPAPVTSDQLAAQAFEAAAVERAQKRATTRPATAAFDSPRTISELAARSLRLVTGRPIEFAAAMPPEQKAAIIAEWRARVTRAK